jgi:methyl-accepting chemotaxis protein
MSIQPRQPTVRDVVTAPIQVAVGVAGEVVSTTTAIVLSPVRAVAAVGSAVARLQRALDHLDDMADGVANMEREMRGMRADLADVIGELEGVRGGVGLLGTSVDAMSDGVGGIRSATETLDSRVGNLNKSIENIDALASRFSRFGGRRKDA